MATYEVRSIQDAELVDWVEAMHLAFHVNRSAEEEATHRRDVRRQDLSRTLAAFDGSALVGTYLSFATQLSLPGTRTTVPTNAITAVSVTPTHRRRGILRAMITSDLEAARQRGEIASALIAAEYPIYGRFGFGPATQQASYTLHTARAAFLGVPPGRVELLDARRMRHIAPPIFEQYRLDCPGQIARDPARWDLSLGVIQAPWREQHQAVRRAAYFPANSAEPTGYAVYTARGDWQDHVPSGKVDVDELIALDREAYLGLWRYLAEIDLVDEVIAEQRSIDEPLRWLLADPRKVWRELTRTDFLWLRPLDTPKLLEARRYTTEDRLVLDVHDPLGIAGGCVALEGGPDGAVCRATTESAQVRLDLFALGALLLGGTDARSLALGALIQEQSSGALTRLARMFGSTSAPWCSTFF